MALDVMGLIGERDRIHEISMRLEKSHLDYLQLDESPQKLKARHKLEGYIKEYLCHVPNESKYVFQETADILHRSAATLKDFSGYRACPAWRAISLYAANLLAQPWRKEYRTLRTYSGYYKHEIEANLIGAELMFELMGYKHTGLGVLALEGPIDPDKVSSVSRDAIVAFVECEIMTEIWEKVSIFFTISWLDVLEFRWNSVGTSEQAIRALNFRFLERMSHIRDKSCPTIYRDHRNFQQSSTDPSQISTIHTTMPHHVYPNNYNPPSSQNNCKPDVSYPSDGNFYFAPVEIPNSIERMTNPYSYTLPISRYNSSSQQSSLTGTTMKSSTICNSTRVPTARLIELDTPLPVANYEKNLTSFNDSTKFLKSRIARNNDKDEVDHRRSQSTDNEQRPIYARIEKKSTKKFFPNDEDENDEDEDDEDEDDNNEKIVNDDWEFIYTGLEHLGYSKDLGERDDVLRNREIINDGKYVNRGTGKNFKTSTKIDREDSTMEKHGKRRISSNPGTRECNFNEDAYCSSMDRENRGRDGFGSKKKIYDDHREAGTIVRDVGQDKKFLTMDGRSRTRGNCSSSGSRTTTRIVDEAATRDTDTRVEQSRGDGGVVENRWNCGFCTFLNRPGREICEICGKSRRKGNEDKPLASGGKECPQCTLVNEKDASSCEACNASLKDSPTYI